MLHFWIELPWPGLRLRILDSSDKSTCIIPKKTHVTPCQRGWPQDLGGQILGLKHTDPKWDIVDQILCVFGPKFRSRVQRFPGPKSRRRVQRFQNAPCNSLSKCHVAPPPQPLPSSHLYINFHAFHWTWYLDQPHPLISIHYILAGKVDLMSKYRGAWRWFKALGLNDE